MNDYFLKSLLKSEQSIVRNVIFVSRKTQRKLLCKPFKNEPYGRQTCNTKKLRNYG